MFRGARRADLDAILKIYARARQAMADSGNPTQWGDHFPPQELLEEELIAKGKCNLKGIRLFWNMVDRRGRKNLYDAWNRVIHRMGLRLLSSHIPNTLRYNKEADPVCKGVFRSTLFPPDPRQEKDSGLPELVEEICHAIGLEESDTER